MRFNKIVSSAFLLITLAASSQTITPQVINSAGGEKTVGTTGIMVIDNVGEPFTQTIGSGSLFITQGFIQPIVVSAGGFSYSAIFQSPKCLENNDDGFISVSLNGTVKNYSVQYYWTPSSVCPTNDCAKIDTLKPGNYSVKVVVSYSNNLGIARVDSIKSQNFVIETPKDPCTIKIYSGVTPNNDGVNDVWIIENIADYPKNRITIYNRWGLEVAEIKGYNNLDKVWPNKATLDFLSASTYFYVIELEEGGKPIKGWLELIKNQ